MMSLYAKNDNYKQISNASISSGTRLALPPNMQLLPTLLGTIVLVILSGIEANSSLHQIKLVILDLTSLKDEINLQTQRNS